MHYFCTLFISAALHAEVRINQKQRLYRQVFKLQIPSRVIGCNMANSRHMKTVIAQIGIVVMQVRDSLFLTFAAAVFSDIVPCCRAGNQRQIHRHPSLCKLSCCKHGDVMNPADMPKGVKRRNINTDTHKLINVFTFYQLVHVDIFLGITLFLHLAVCEKLHILGRVERQMFSFKAVHTA